MTNTRSHKEKLEQLIPKIVCYINLKCRIYELRAIFEPRGEADNRPLKDYAVLSQDESHSSIVPPAIQGNSFELKPSLIQIMKQKQFYGNPTEDPNLHLYVFV